MTTSDSLNACREAFQGEMKRIYGMDIRYHEHHAYGAFQDKWVGWQACWNNRHPIPQALVEAMEAEIDGPCQPFYRSGLITALEMVKQHIGEGV